MKQLIILLFFFGLIACGGEKKAETEEVKQEVMQEMPAEADTAMVDTTMNVEEEME